MHLSPRLGLLLVAIGLVLGAAGLTGHLVGEDDCLVAGDREGTLTSVAYRWSPPGQVCVLDEPSSGGTVTPFVYENPSRLVARTGSWPAFLAALAVGFGLVWAARRSRPGVPAWSRIGAATALALAVAGLGAFAAGGLGASFVGVVAGVPVAVIADRHLRSGPGRSPLAGAGAGLAAVVAVVAGWLGWSFGLGTAGYAAGLATVVAVTASVR